MKTQSDDAPHSPYSSMAFLFDALIAPVKLAVLETAVELDLAHILGTTSKVDEIAAKAGVKTDTAGLVVFLDAMVALGLATKKNNTYENTELGRRFFDRESQVFIGEFVQSMKALVHENLADMAAIIKNGPPEDSQTESWQDESRWERSVAHLATGQRAGMAALYADLVEELQEFKSINKILDLGGGPGLIGAEILRRLPGATGVLLDLPAVIRLAEKEIEKEGMADRISCLAGDYNEIDFGGDYDLIWASHNLYFVKDRVPFFQRVKQSMADNGVFVCLHEGLTCEQTAPASIVLMRLSSSLAKGGQNFSLNRGELVSCLKQAGFERVDSRMIDVPAGESELVMARKLPV